MRDTSTEIVAPLLISSCSSTDAPLISNVGMHALARTVSASTVSKRRLVPDPEEQMLRQGPSGLQLVGADSHHKDDCTVAS
jgi:hypothetical protein